MFEECVNMACYGDKVSGAFFTLIMMVGFNVLVSVTTLVYVLTKR